MTCADGWQATTDSQRHVEGDVHTSVIPLKAALPSQSKMSAFISGLVAAAAAATAEPLHLLETPDMRRGKH